MKKLISILTIVLISATVYAQTWKNAAQDSILKYRTSPLIIHVVDESDQPAENVSVHVKLIKHEFKWGSTVDINYVSRVLGNTNSFNVSSPYINHLRLFNSVTPNNAGKWKGWIDGPQRAMYLRTIDWLESEGIWNRGHTCVWESERFNAVPDILKGQTDTAFIRSKVKSHIYDNMSTLSGKIYEMDVVNELVHEQAIVDGLLNVPDPALEHSMWYKWAKDAAPDVDLVVNEFDLFQSGNNFYQSYITYVQKMIADGAPVDRVGMQGHFWSTMPYYDELKKRINQVKPLGLPMAVTEFDMVGKSYDDMERVLYAVFSEPLMYGFTIWGAWDGVQWRNNGPIFEDNWDIKPSGRAWLDLVHGKWSNDTTIVTDATGSLSLDAYKGMHKITLRIGDSIFVDTVVMGDEPVEMTYQTGLITSNVPDGTLSVEGNTTEFNVYQPALLKLNTTSPEAIAKVEFFEDLLMQHRDSAASFGYELVNTYSGIKNIHAKVTAKNGYTFITDTLELSFVNKNAFPNISAIYPFRNQSFIYGNDITVALEASDFENQLWKAELTGIFPDSVLTDTTYPFAFTLPSPEPGTYAVEVKVLDSLYGFSTKTTAFSIINPNSQNLSVSSPNAADDDIEEEADGSIALTGDLDMGEKMTGILFKNSGIPKNATIDSAFIQFTSDNANQGAITIPIMGELTTSPDAYTNASGNLSSRTELTAAVNWSPATWDITDEDSTAQKTNDLKQVIADIVDLDAWNESGIISIILGFSDEPDTKRRAVSYDLDPTRAPRLFVYYTGGIDLSQPNAPQNLRITAKTGSEIKIKWDPPADDNAIGYFVYIDGEIYEQSGTSYTSETLDLTAGAHSIYVTAISPFSVESDPSNTISSDDEISVGTLISKIEHSLSAYPNPFSDKVTIWVGNATVDHITVYNHLGQIVDILPQTNRAAATMYTWDGKDDSGNDVAPGLYMVVVSGEKKREVIKVVKQP